MITAALIYHDVVEPGAFDQSGFRGASADSYKLTRTEFSRHLRAIAAALRGQNPVTLPQVDSPAAATAGLQTLLTFDDGGVGAIRYTADALEEAGWRGIFFIATDFIGSAGFLGSADIAALNARGHAIGSHSASHPARMSACGADEMRREWRLSVDALSGIVGRPIRLASVPGGYYSPRVAAAAAAEGITLLMTSEPTGKTTLINGCSVVGRYSITARTSPQTAARLACGNYAATTSQALAWNAKKALKTLGGRQWIRLREALFEAQHKR